MEFTLDEPFDGMTNQPPQTAGSMQQLLNNNPVPHPQVNHAMQWTASPQQGAELPTLHMQGPRPPSYPVQHRSVEQDSHHSGLRFAPRPPQPLHRQPPATDEVTTVNSSSNFALNDSPPIEPDVVNHMGGLPYADMCKEKAREAYKEMKKNLHMASGEFERIKRRKKGDTSMSPREKYVRRLKMNQDSAAAARHAQDVYVHVLEKLVETTEVEKKSALIEAQHLRHQNNLLNDKVGELQSLVDNLGRVDPTNQVAKLLDLMTNPELVSAQVYDPEFKNSMNNGPTSAA